MSKDKRVNLSLLSSTKNTSSKTLQSSLSPLTGTEQEDLFLLTLTVTYINVGDEKTDITLVQQVAHISTPITFKMQFHCQKVPVACCKIFILQAS